MALTNAITEEEMETLSQLLSILRPARQEPADETETKEAPSEDYFAPVWFDIKGACSYVHVSRSKFYQLIKEGKVPTCRVGRKRMVRRTVLDQLLESGELA